MFIQFQCQHTINNEGFVIVDFLNAEEVTNLLNLHHNKHSENIKGFYTSTFSKDVVYRREVDSLIQQSMQRGLESYFENYRVHCGSFIIKAADEKRKQLLEEKEAQKRSWSELREAWINAVVVSAAAREPVAPGGAPVVASEGVAVKTLNPEREGR
mgnify:CR=1 FL=1